MLSPSQCLYLVIGTFVDVEDVELVTDVYIVHVGNDTQKGFK